MEPPRDSQRHCTRCRAETLGGVNRPEHLCKDKADRLKRQTRQRAAVIALLAQHSTDDGIRIEDDEVEDVAEAIVRRLNNLGITED